MAAFCKIMTTMCDGFVGERQSNSGIIELSIFELATFRALVGILGSFGVTRVGKVLMTS
jgi:hypothetical protein